MKHQIMSFILILLFGSQLSSNAFAQEHYVKGYHKRNGAYVQGYMRTSPNTSKYDNYGRTKWVDDVPVHQAEPVYTQPVQGYQGLPNMNLPGEQ